MTDFHNRITPTHVDKPLINKPEEKFCFTAPAVGIVVRILLDCYKEPFLLEVTQYPVNSSRIKRRSALKLSKATQEHTSLIEGRNRNETFLLAEGEIFFAASRGDVDDAGAFSLAHCIPRYHSMYLTGRFCGSPFLFHRYIGNSRWETSRTTLCLELIKRAIIGPSQYPRPRYLPKEFVAAFFLEDLFNGLEFGYSLDPFLSSELLFKALRRKSALGQI